MSKNPTIEPTESEGPDFDLPTNKDEQSKRKRKQRSYCRCEPDEKVSILIILYFDDK